MTRDPQSMTPSTHESMVTFSDDAGFEVVIWTDGATPRIMARYKDPEDPWGASEPTSLWLEEIFSFVKEAQTLMGAKI